MSAVVGSEHMSESYEVDAGVAVLRAPRPPGSRSALSGFLDLLERASADPDARVVVIAGGAGFGRDELWTEPTDAGEVPFPLAGFALGVPKPVIAAVSGATTGTGLTMALTCDVRYASEDATFATAFARQGRVAERASAWLLPRVVGLGSAMDLALSARTIDAGEARRIGLVDRVVPESELIGAACAWAREVAARCSPAAVAVIKQQLHRALETSLSVSLDEANTLAVAAIKGSDADEGIRSFVERRSPTFAPLAPGAVTYAVGTRR